MFGQRWAHGLHFLILYTAGWPPSPTDLCLLERFGRQMPEKCGIIGQEVVAKTPGKRQLMRLYARGNEASVASAEGAGAPCGGGTLPWQMPPKSPPGKNEGFFVW